MNNDFFYNAVLCLNLLSESSNYYVYLIWDTYLLPVNKSIIYSIKLVAMLSFLLLMRGGTPRYRYDYLTKLGWLKFLSFNLSILVILSIFYFIS